MLSAGTSVGYNYVDYRFKNETDQVFQLLAWCEGEEFFCQLRAQEPIPYSYHFTEEDRHYKKEGKLFYHLSKIYLVTSDESGKELKKELIWDNHSKVMYDYSLIPKELIRE